MPVGMYVPSPGDSRSVRQVRLRVHLRAPTRVHLAVALGLALEAARQVVALRPAGRLLALFLVNHPAPMRISPYAILMVHISKLLALLERQPWLHVQGLIPVPAQAATAVGWSLIISAAACSVLWSRCINPPALPRPVLGINPFSPCRGHRFNYWFGKNMF